MFIICIKTNIFLMSQANSQVILLDLLQAGDTMCSTQHLIKIVNGLQVWLIDWLTGSRIYCVGKPHTDSSMD